MSKSKVENWVDVLHSENAPRRQKTPYLKLSPGVNKLRIVPPHGDRDTFWLTVLRSFNVGPNRRTIIWPQEGRAEFPIQVAIDELKAAGDDASKARADAMRPTRRALMWVIDRKHPEKGPQLWETTYKTLMKILEFVADPDFGDVTDPEDGFDVKVTYTPGAKADTYKVLFSKSTPLDYPEALDEDLFEVFDVGRSPSLDFVNASLEGTENKQNNERQSPPTTASVTTDEEEIIKRELAKARARKKQGGQNLKEALS